jgi:hypothetical protein
MNAIKLICLISGGLLSIIADAATIRLPTRYVITQYTVHKLTGLTSGEVTKERTMDSPLEITPHNEDGEKFIRFTAPAGTGTDYSGESVVLLPLAKQSEMVQVLKSLPKLCSEARSSQNPEDGSEVLFSNDNLSITFIKKVVHRSAYADLKVGTREYVLRNDNSIEKLAKIIDSFK